MSSERKPSAYVAANTCNNGNTTALNVCMSRRVRKLTEENSPRKTLWAAAATAAAGTAKRFQRQYLLRVIVALTRARRVARSVATVWLAIRSAAVGYYEFRVSASPSLPLSGCRPLSIDRSISAKRTSGWYTLDVWSVRDERVGRVAYRSVRYSRTRREYERTWILVASSRRLWRHARAQISTSSERDRRTVVVCVKQIRSSVNYSADTRTHAPPAVYSDIAVSLTRRPQR